MNIPEIKILETIIALFLFFVIRIVIFKLIDRTVTKNFLHKTRGKITKKIFQIVLNKILGSMSVRGLISLGTLLLIIYGAYSFLTL